MPELQPAQPHSLSAAPDQPLIGIPVQTDGEEVVCYFTDEEEVDRASTPASIQRALSLAGAWKDLGDWEEAFDELDRIRHESKPTPPIDLDL